MCSAEIKASTFSIVKVIFRVSEDDRKYYRNLYLNDNLNLNVNVWTYKRIICYESHVFKSF